MFWVGGDPGAGKSTVARRLAHELDLLLHPIDAHRYDHVDRLGELGPPLDEVGRHVGHVQPLPSRRRVE
ncbi:MAG: hypothetical protein ACTHOD_10135 [Motilibacteraceae bacterium]